MGRVAPREARQRYSSPRIRFVAGLGRDEGRSHDVAGDPQPDESPVEHIAARPRFVTHAQPLAWVQPANQFRDGFGAIGDDTQDPHFSVGFGDGSAMVSVWTSRPKYRRLLLIDRLLRM